MVNSSVSEIESQMANFKNEVNFSSRTEKKSKRIAKMKQKKKKTIESIRVKKRSLRAGIISNEPKQKPEQILNIQRLKSAQVYPEAGIQICK